MQPLLRSRLSSIAIAVGSFFPFQINPALAGIDNHTPTSGQTVTGDTSFPNPDRIGVAAVPGSTNVTVNILTGSQISVININGILIRNQGAGRARCFHRRTSDLHQHSNGLHYERAGVRHHCQWRCKD